ncbi:MAG: hypothetical protein DSY58_07180 [Desulfobulbus sp.]|nr:MAG: hypothetical protein DSY58_07180 [Desulfobulbus sp.]
MSFYHELVKKTAELAVETVFLPALTGCGTGAVTKTLPIRMLTYSPAASSMFIITRRYKHGGHMRGDRACPDNELF